jgi:hypothetical protein
MAQWWLVATSSENGQPFNVIAFQGTQAQAQAADSSGLTAGGWPLGPYASQAGADAAAVKATGKVAGNSPGLSSPNPVTDVEQPFADVASALSAFYDKLTDGKMWRSLGWLLLGIALMIAGIALLLKGELTRGAVESLAGI